MTAATRGSGGGRHWGSRALGLAAGVVAALVAALLLLGVVRERRAVRAAFPLVEGRVPVAALAERVRVLRDARGVPHIEAAGESDAYVGLGFVHAQDRLAQMIWLRRGAQGRLAEVMGEALLPSDREARLLGIAQHARRATEALAPADRALLEAYAAGVNAWMERLRTGNAVPPIALERFSVPLEPWQAEDCIALIKLYAWGLAGNIDAGLALQDLIEQLGGFAARAFFPPGVGLEAPLRQVEEPRSARVPPFRPPGSLLAATGLVGRSLGSSAFVVAGGHTRSGRPILAADAHLPATAPSLFYQAHLVWSEGEVAGAGIPGIPLFWMGHNGRVAWAAVNPGVALVDLYVETLHPEDADLYHDGREWTALRRRPEEIAVRGRDPEALVVLETRRGPIVTALVGEEREPLALAWPGARDGGGVNSFLQVARASNAGELRAALKDHHEPVVSVVYADRDGAAGRQLAGWIPHRSLPTGLVPVPGRNRWYEWQSAIPPQLLPRVTLDDDRPFALAADARLTTPEDPVGIEWTWRTGDRARRIEALLRAALRQGPLDLRDAVALQRDVYSPGHRGLVRAVLELAGSPDALDKEARWVAEALERWDGESSVASRGATVYHVFLDRLQEPLLEPVLGPELLARYLSIPQMDPTHVLRKIVIGAVGERNDAAALVDRDAVARAIRESLRATWIWLSVRLGPNHARWEWGRLHQLRFRWLWAASGWELGSLGPFPVPGDGSSVATSEYDPANPFDARIASTFRFALDLAAPQEALTILAPGQSGHPGHPQSRDGLARWRKGSPRLLATSQLLVEETAVAELVLEPAP
jgi:penicillin amidase